MSWDRLVEFVQAEAPSFVASLEGVVADDIVRVEDEYRVQLPATYRQYLLRMGVNSAEFYLFGPSHNHRFADIVERLPEATYPTHEYFKIAYAQDETMISPLDYFLDLKRNDGVDAPIVMFEGGEDEEFVLENVQEHGFTFLEQAYRRLFGHVANLARLERKLLTILSSAPARETLSMAHLVEVLKEMRFDLALPALARVTCLRRGSVWAVVDVHASGRGLAISLWSTERGTLEALTDQLSLRFPDARVTDRGRPPRPRHSAS